MSSRVLFLINGLGLGNSTRCHAVIQHLAAAGAAVEVVTSDNGLWFFADNRDIVGLTAVPALRYGQRNGGISIAATLAAAGEMRDTLRQVDAALSAAIARFHPDVVVTDSVYAFRAARRAGLPLAALNNADMVVRGMVAGRRRWPAAVLPQFLAVEVPDFLFHRTVPDLVISPRLDPADRAAAGPFRPVAPIVRRECRPAEGESGNGRPRRVVIMLSGSVFGSPVTLTRPLPDGLTVDVVGRPAPSGPEREGIRHHGRTRESFALLQAADLMVVNGGFSAVSEAVMLRKPVVVVPVPRHAEQWVNADTVARLGIGMAATEDRLEEAMYAALARIDAFRPACRRLPAVDNGAVEAARLILRLAQGERP